MLDTPFSIRDANAEDLSSLAELEWANTRPLLDIPRDEAAYKADCVAHLKKSLSQGAPILLCEDTEGLVGYCGCSFATEDHGTLSFDSVQITPRRQQQGLAVLLTDALLRRLRAESRVRRVRVNIRRGSPGIELYRRLGFTELKSSATHLLLELSL